VGKTSEIVMTSLSLSLSHVLEGFLSFLSKLLRKGCVCVCVCVCFDDDDDTHEW
jgi:hypothetical protein